MHVVLWLFPFFQGLLAGLVAMAFHEAGHLVTAPAVGIRIKSVGMTWKGLYTVREAGPPLKNMIVSIAGPFTNVVLLALWPLSPKLGLANLCFAFFNLLPMEGSDGERVWKCWRALRRERLRKSAPYTAYSQTSDPEFSHLVGESPARD